MAMRRILAVVTNPGNGVREDTAGADGRGREAPTAAGSHLLTHISARDYSKPASDQRSRPSAAEASCPSGRSGCWCPSGGGRPLTAAA
jgi:hypothetical protein